MNAPLNINSVSVDTLGSLLAQIADLTKQADAIKDAIKDQATLPHGAKVVEGSLFKATVVEQNRSTVDYKALLSALNVTEEMVAPFVKVTAVFAVKTTSK
jgi:hypothetical protein